MNWFRRHHQEVITPEAFTLFLLKVAGDSVKRTIQFLKEEPLLQDNPILAIGTEHSKLPKVENELMFLYYFALDYWIHNSPRTQDERDTIREALHAHWLNMLGGDYEGQGMLDTLQERLIAYGQIVNDKKNPDTVKSLRFGRKLSEFCGMPGFFVGLLPMVLDLMDKARESLERLSSVRLKLR